MMTAAILALALTASQAQALPLQAGDVDCGGTGFRKAAGDPLRLRKLNELPAAKMELAIDRRVGKCTVPVIIVRDLDGSGPPPLRRGDAPSNRR